MHTPSLIPRLQSPIIITKCSFSALFNKSSGVEPGEKANTHYRLSNIEITNYNVYSLDTSLSPKLVPYMQIKG